ncbi:MAG: response regulator [Planctomycetes bacterium]|nr:response regulator [Planctomycetota bacterium]
MTTDGTHVQPPDAANAPTEGAAVPAHVLVVDDQPIVREFLAEVLRVQGHRVSLAERGEAALDLIRKDPPHVVLTDLKMNGMDGHDLVRRIRASHPAVVPVVITGFGTVQHAVDVMRDGAFDVLTKPCPAAEIVSTVAKALEHQRALQTNADLRERLRVQEKLAMIGKLAAGVAHELNNPLDATLRCVRMVASRTGGDAESKELLDLAHAGLLRMADIVKSLLTFSRHAAIQQKPEPLARLVEEAVAGVAMAVADLAPKITSELAPDVAEHPVPRALHQVLTNVVRNAADATGPTGHVQVRARRDGDRVRIEVRDDGPGMPPGVLQRIFEPFFTTKPPGKGTGLGLPISARVVENLGGAITVECPPSGGTLVRVTLPFAPSGAPASAR